MNSLPLSVWKPRITNGYWASKSCSTGTRARSLIWGTQPRISHWDLIDGIEVVEALLTVAVALMDGIDPQVARLALGIGAAAFAILRRSGLGPAHRCGVSPVARGLAQAVELGHRDGEKARKLRTAKEGVLPLEGGWSGKMVGAASTSASRRVSAQVNLVGKRWRW
jgi:hypothetical protein